MEPGEIRIIVHGARGLQGRKKGRHKYNVVFGIGNKRFKTDVQQDPTGNPIWTEESTIEIDNNMLPLVFFIREKDDILGQVSVPLSGLPSEDMRGKKKFPLQPHRKCNAPQGELIFEAWVSKYRKQQVAPPTIKVTCEPLSPSRLNPFAALKDTINKSPIMGRKILNKSKVNKPLLTRRNSRSLHDLTDLKFESRLVNQGTGIQTNLDPPKGDLGKRCNSSYDLADDGTRDRPEITTVSPSSGSIEGGTELTIKGANLGVSKDDVVGLFVCGANCLKTLEYVSITMLKCRTKAWRACKGYIVVETQTGGKGTSLVQYTFSDSANEANEGQTESSSDNRRDQDIPPGKEEENKKAGIFSRFTEGKVVKRNEVSCFSTADAASLQEANTELRAEIKLLKEKIKALEENQASMKLYLDHLVARVMEECPEALCAGSASAAGIMALK